MKSRLTCIAAAIATTLSASVAYGQASPANQSVNPVQSPTEPSASGLSFIRPEATVTLYGLIDATISYVSHADAAGKHLFDYQVPWFSGSRWGITGRRAIGASTNAIFKLESEYLIQTGEMDTPGVLFNRDAWVGFQGDWGKLTFGRQNTLPRDFAQTYGDPYGSAQVGYEEGGWTNTNQFKQLIYYAGSITSTRYDKGVVYKLIQGPLAFGAGFQFGEAPGTNTGIPGDFSNGTTKAIALGYNGGVFNASGFYNDGERNGAHHKAWSVGGNFTTGIFRLNAGYFDYKADQPTRGDRKDKAWTVSTKIAPPGPVDFEAGYQQIKVDNAGIGSATGNVPNPFATTPGGTLVASGKKKTLYASAFYHFNRFVEVYLAADHAKFNGTYRAAAAHGFTDITEVAAGIRLRF
jgi:predicted porin